MAVKISGMTPATTPLAGTELVEIVQGSPRTSVRVAASDIAASGSGGGLEIIQNIDVTLAASGTFTSVSFTVDIGDYIIFDILGDKDNGAGVSLTFDLTGDLNLVNTTVTSATQLKKIVGLKGSLGIKTAGGFVFYVKANMTDLAGDTFDGNTDYDGYIGTDGLAGSPEVATSPYPTSTTLTITEDNSSDDYRLVGYIAKVL